MKRKTKFKLVALGCSSLLALAIGGIGSEMFFRAKEKANQKKQMALLEASDLHAPLKETSDQTYKGLFVKSPYERQLYRLKPNLDTHFLGIFLKTNKYGFRDSEWTIEKTLNTFRIATIGDSFTFGSGNPFIDEVYPKVLEQMLNLPNDNKFKYEVLNLSVPGYNVENEVETLKRDALKFSPDACTWLCIKNDLQFPLEHFRRIGSGDSELRILQKVKKSRYSIDGLVGGDSSLAGNDIGWDVFENSLVEAKQLMSGKPAFFMATDSNSDEKLPDILNYSLKIAEKAGFVCINPLLAYRRFCKSCGIDSISELWANSGDEHPGKYGHQILARSFLESLVQNKAIPDYENIGRFWGIKSKSPK